MDQGFPSDAAPRRNRVTVHGVDREYDQLLRTSRSQPLSVLIRQIVGPWANAHDGPRTALPQRGYEDGAIGDHPEQENVAPATKQERTHYQSLRKGGSFHDTASV